MPNIGDYNKAFLKCQHKFRGLVSDFKSTKFVKKKRFDHSFQFRSGYRDLMLEARSVLHPSMYSDYLQWASFHVKHQLPELSRHPTGYDELEGLGRNTPIVSIDKEVFWIVARINENFSVINAFRKMVTHIEKSVLDNDVVSAIEHLKDLDLNLGASFWSVQLRIALENIIGGLEGQKKYTSEVRSIYKSGLLNFIAYNTSVRNEDRVSIQKYLIDIKQRIRDHSKYDEPVKFYMYHRMISEWPSNNKNIADVLRVEQSHSLIDVYETFVSLLQYSLHDDVGNDLKTLMKSALIKIKNIDDFRLEKACLSYDLPFKVKFLKSRDSRLSESLFSGNILLSANLSRTILRNKEVDAWNYIYSGVTYSFGKLTVKSIIPKNIPILIGQLLRQDEDSSNAYVNLLKMTTNLAGLPACSAIRIFIKLIYRVYPDEKWRFDLVSINSPNIGAEDYINAVHIDHAPVTSQCWAQLFQPCVLPVDLNNMAISIFQACGLIGRREYDSAIDILINCRKLFPKFIPAFTIQLLLNSYFSADMRQNVIELIADEGSRNNSRRDLIPVGSAIGDYYIQDFNRVRGVLTASVALHLLWEKTEKDIVGSNLRFKTAQVIRRKDVQAPAALFELKEEIELHILIYFLREICVPNIVDQARVVKTSKEVIQQRQDTCSVLRELDPGRASDYEDEIFEITNRRIMSDGQRIVDRTRVHVDVPALTRWTNRELSEDFYRYSDLAKVVTPIEFDEVMRDILNDNKIPVQFSDFDEADAVLYSMLMKIASEFLNNSLFGLDYYLSKRIRHQSFVGFIRGPLEVQRIITTKENGSSGYNRNDFWLNKFNSCNRDKVSSLEKIFNNFSSSFDEAIIETKDKIIQIKSKDHPQGLVWFEINPQIVPVARILFQDGDLSGFVKTSVGLMWALLDRSLRDVREYISGELKNKVTIIFDEFRAELKKLVDGRSEYFELCRAIGDSSVQVQLALDDASGWFSKNNDLDTFRRTFNTSQAVSISIEAAKKCLRSFDPEITIEPIATDIDVMPSTLVFLHDVLFVSLDNARVHSGLKEPKIHVEVVPDIDGGKFVIRTRCQAKSSVRIGAEKKLSEIRDKIERGEYDTKTKTEGGSGLYKIAAVVKQSVVGAIEFGFNSSGDFEIAVTYHFLVQSRKIAGSFV